MTGKELARTNEGKRGDGTLIMENARILFRNFAGVEGKYNREGDRNFCILLEDEGLVADMIEDGWNVKRLRPREGEEQGSAYIQVSVGFKGRPPRMAMITSKGRVNLCTIDDDGKVREDEAILLDWADIKQADVIIRPYNWNVNGRTGVKAYLKSIFVIINEDYLELKYADVPMAELESARPIAIEAGDGLDDMQMGEDGMPQSYEDDEDDMDIVDAELVER